MRYDWNELFDTFGRKEIKQLSPKFPLNFDAIFDDNNNNIKIITNYKYITIPIENFPVCN